MAASNNPYRYVKLLKNHLYPTYQLHAFMANVKTAPKDGLRLAALTTMHWLRSRLGEVAPSEWENLPAPEEYLSATDEDLPSFYLNQGFVINIVSLPDRGTWTLQITEPDLGSDPGNPAQKRPPVPGRIIESNIAFQIVDKQLECGFKTIMSDPVGMAPEAEVYRTTVVRLLMENPAFGLKQVTDIPMKPLRLTGNSQVKTMLWVTHHADNQLPTVIFTQLMKEKKAAPSAPDLSKLCIGNSFMAKELNLPSLNLPKPAAPAKVETEPIDPPYDLNKFCYYTFSHCRTYVLEHVATSSFTTQSDIRFKPGDILVLYPPSLGGGERVLPYSASDSVEDTIETVEKGIKDSLKTRDVDFGRIMFLSGVREQLLHLSDELLKDAEIADISFKTEIEQLNASWQNVLAQKEQEVEAINSQLQRQKDYASKLEADKVAMREAFAEDTEKLQKEINKYQETIAFLKRRYDQPNNYEGIAAWVEEHFSDRLLLHSKAIERLLKSSSRGASVELVCDALDFLATDYWDMRYRQVPKDLALTRCGEKYGRPFLVKPTGQVTIEAFPGEYRIKYYNNAQGNVIDSDLDYHLRVGNDSENLLRVYFLHDDEKQLIVVGSLPDHLSSVKVQ